MTLQTSREIRWILVFLQEKKYYTCIGHLLDDFSEGIMIMLEWYTGSNIEMHELLTLAKKK